MKQEKNVLDLDDNEETLVRPLPGLSEDPETMVLPHPDETLILEQSDPLFEGIPASNPFCVRASSLLSLVPKLRMQASHDNVKGLHKQLVDEIKEFEALDPESGISGKQNKVAGYFLCALLDEAVLNTPWGRESDWKERSLLFRFHKDGQEGRKFFVILKQLLQNPKQYVHLIELAYICLSLGYEGVYCQAANGPRTIAQHRQNLFDLIQRIKGPDEDVLSDNWQGIKSSRKSMIPEIPIWVSLVTAGVVLLLFYFGAIYFINRNSDKVSQRLDRIAQKETTLPSTPQKTNRPVAIPIPETTQAMETVETLNAAVREEPVPTLDIDKLKQALVHDIEKNKVTVLSGPTLRISNAFRSGSDKVREEFFAVLTRIAKIADEYDSRILVVGHTDNQPMFSGRFPSNWHLSEARAKSVANRLAITEELAERIRFEGHGASEPIVANDTEQHRALNRRIDIHIR